MKEPSIPTPLPLPPPPLETTTVHLPMRSRIRHTSVTSSTTTSSRSSSLSSSPTLSSSSSRSSSSIPFSWEHQPGIPKNPNGFEALALPLPLPPSRHSTGTVTIPRSGSGAGSKHVSDPFITALSECAKEGFECVPVGTATHVHRRSKAVRPMSVPAINGRFGLLDLYGCKTAISVVDAAVSLPQTGRRVSTYRVISRQNRSEKR